MQDCKMCPSFVDVSDVAIAFGKQTAVPMCKRFSIPLGRPGLPAAQNETIQQHFAMNCPGFGQEAPAKPVESRAYVMQPDSTVMQKFRDPTFVPDDLTTCRQCENLVSSDVVAGEIGYPVELCRAQGKLVMRPQQDCKGCVFATRGEMSRSTDGLEILPEYTETFRLSTEKAVEGVFSMGSTNTEPTDYESDAPVEEAHRLAGVSAWRCVKSPYGMGEVFLPILNPLRFTDEQRALIPTTGDKNMPEQYVDYQNLLWDFAANSYKLRETLCLQGIPGVGKTEFARFMAYLMQMPFVEFNFNNDSEIEDLVGSPQYSAERGTFFELGRIPLAFGQDCITLYDELNAAPNSVRQLLRPVFAKGTELVVDSASPAIRIQRGTFNYGIVAQNPADDVRNSGVEQLASAEFDRLSVVTVDLPPEPVERHIIAMRCENDGFMISEGQLDKLMKIAADIREAAEQQSIPFTWGIRQQIKVARKLPYYPMVEAYKRSALDFYEESSVKLVLDAITTHGA